MVKPWARLDEILRPKRTPFSVWLFGGCVGLLLPLQILLAGWIFQILLGKSGDQTLWLELGEWIQVPSWVLLGDGSRLKGVVVLLILLFCAATIQLFFLWLLEKSSARYALDRTMKLLQAIYRKSGQLASLQSISGQKSTLRTAIQLSSPRVRNAWELKTKIVPRYIVQGIACLGLALCIHPVLALLAVICVALLGQIYRSLDLRERTSHPVLNERILSLKQRILELCETGPLLAFVHAEDASLGSLESQLRSLHSAEQQLLSSKGIKKPVMAFFIALAVCFVGLILAIRMLQPDSNLHLPSAFIFFGAMAAATIAAIRLSQAWSGFTKGSESARSLVSLLTQLDDEPTVLGQQPLPKIANRIELDHVTLRDSEGRKLLEDICVELEPGKLTAVIASDRVQARAMAEMVLGFGRPSSGRILLDSANIIDVDPPSLRKHSAWIGPDGPLVAGTLEDNLHNERAASLAELTDAVRAAGVYEAIQNLPDGLTTLVSPHDDRLNPDYLFRLGVARSIAKKPSLVVAEEPEVRVAQAIETDTLESLRELTRRGMFVLVLPNRLLTLRNADRIIVLHEHKVSAIGTHAELLESSELYRHLNYIRFSPLRHIMA